MRKNILLRIYITSLCLLLFHHCSAQQHQRGIMTYEEYNKLSISPPYVLNLTTNSGGLIYFGAEHMYDSSNHQFAQIDSLWKMFKPTIAFSEGGLWPIAKTREQAIERYGEQGLLGFLANRDQIPIQSVEPNRRDEVRAVTETIKPEQLKLFYILRQVVQFRRMRDSISIDEKVRNFIAEISEVPGLQCPPNTSAELEKSYQKTISKNGNWRNVAGEWVYPTENEKYTNQIARAVSRYRNEHMVRLLVQQVKKGERVFAVVGMTHVVMQEPALRDVLTH
jgi:hypothetical protein